MYTGFRVRNFRCFQKLYVGGLKRVNLIAGENNVGKSALLEALFLHMGGSNPHLVVTIDTLRGITAYRVKSGNVVEEPPWRSLFQEFNEEKEIELTGEGCARAARTLLIRTREYAGSAMPARNGGAALRVAEARSSQETPRALELTDVSRGKPTRLYVEEDVFRTEPASLPPPPFPGYLLSARGVTGFKEDSELYGRLDLRNEQVELIQILRLLEPRLRRLSTIVAGGEPMLHADIGWQRLTPIAYLGDGVVRLARLALRMLEARGGILLVDEIENGLHHSVLHEVWKALGETARRAEVQLFATTHSWECAEAAHLAFSEDPEYDFSLQRLERAPDGGIRAVAYDREALAGAIEAGLEVR